MSGAPASSTGTVPSLCVLQQTAATAAAGPSVAGQQSPRRGDEGLPPVVRPLLGAAARQHESSTGSNSQAATRPSIPTSATLAPDVPRSTARM